MTAEWSVHGFAEPKKSSEWKLSPSGDATQRTTMKAYLLTVTKCHKKSLTHAPARAPTDASRQTPTPNSAAAAHSRTATAANHTAQGTTFKCNIQTRNDNPRTKGFCPHMATCHNMSHGHESPLTLPLVHTPAHGARSTDNIKESKHDE